MIYEFVIEPDVLHRASRSYRDSRDLINKFRVGEPNVISNYPEFKKFKSVTYKSSPAELSDLDMMRLDELIDFVGEALKVKRSAPYDKGAPWIDNVKREEQRVHFDHVLTEEQRSAFSSTTLQQLFEGVPLHPRQLLVRRQVDGMVAAVGNMLRLATEIVFVDPYVRTYPDSWNPLVSFVRASLDGSPCKQRDVRVLYWHNPERGSPSVHKLVKKFRHEQPELAGSCNLEFIAIKEIEGREKIHNRYILTDIGGVSFGVGLAEESESHQDDVVLLDADIYRVRWQQYALLDEFEVVASEFV